MVSGTQYVRLPFIPPPLIFEKKKLIIELVSLAVDFFNHLNMLYGTVTEFCTASEVRISPFETEYYFA